MSKVEIRDCKTPVRVTVLGPEGDQRSTLEGREGALFYLFKDREVQVKPFAASERDFGNRTMTTTVIIHPHPAPGLKVKVDLVSPIDGGVNSTEYLKAGDAVKTVYAHDGMAVHVSEVPDEPMQEVEGDTLPGEQVHDPEA